MFNSYPPLWLYLEIGPLRTSLRINETVRRGCRHCVTVCPIKGETPGMCMHTREKSSEDSDVAIRKPRRKVSPETNPADALILDVQHSEQQESIFLLLKPSSLGVCPGSPSRLIQ